MSFRRAVAAGCAFVLICLLVLTGFVAAKAWAWHRDHHRTIGSFRLADGDRLELAYEDLATPRLMVGPSDRGCVFHWLRWQHGRSWRRYLVAWNESRPPAIELRADPTQQQLWLACGGEVIASLDRATGKFINRGGWLVDPLWDTATQKDDYAVEGRSAGPPQPDWATPTGGQLLATTESFCTRLDEASLEAGIAVPATQMPAEEGGLAFGYGG